MKKKLLLLLVGLSLLSIIVISSSDDTLSGDVLGFRIRGAIISCFVFLILWVIFAALLLKPESKRDRKKVSDRYDDVKTQELNRFGINSDEFKKMIYEKFVDIHTSFAACDYDVLKKNLTNDLYQYYVEQLETSKKNGYKKIMKDFKLIDIKIFKVTEEHDLLRIEIYLNVKMLDYVIDIYTGNCIDGSSSEKIHLEFELCFEKRGKENSVNNQYVMSKKICINNVLDERDDLKRKKERL